MTAILEAKGVSISFGGIKAVQAVGLAVEKGELLGLIGPNGAGKTTFLRLLTGIVQPMSGTIVLNGKDVTRAQVDRRARAGLAMTHQIVRPFRSMTTVENVMLAAGHRMTRSPVSSLLHRDRASSSQRAMHLLGSVGLADVAHKAAGLLPLGQLKRLEVARALALDPDILLLDEPLAGLNQSEATTLGDLIIGLNRDGLTIVLVEHRLAEVMRIVGRLAVLDQGRLMAVGEPADVMARPDVRSAYLGGH
ncbi:MULTISPECIES: ABC transporter ATP-binding protein [unclassified Rhizobium]|uniref:ABC transporter ATP-binding protein n=1 Tax=unclassified Rhizobium TaxID=2613769 RepID=UPI000BC802A7|nr:MULTISPECIES: ABC transporter ATP-binding protein [unclassified Rhizobium]MDH7809620.1 branched-chain amino acid transport system ATP-binding protein [Rhizobium sp. AN67]SOD50187.1 amino acid/amide ABC transporter ATP-binding protein 1, HAAT family (TC 3.A.1.4.-) [Rhizobium sp. AN6A]SOD50643.1 amino acid/amide ABC transporter ATP-binding protein 1, HAAT family (TC 3.A.1.4.-) [Rhizobium sp. AN6A]